MPPLDEQHRGQVAEMIREGLQRGLEIHTQQVTAVQTQLATAGNELEARLAEFTTKMESQVSTLRTEFEVEFAKSATKMAEINEKLKQFDLSFEDKKIALNLEITASFAEFGSKCTEMRALIGESSTVLEDSRKMINGAILAINARLDTMYEGMQTAFRAIHTKNVGYDAIIKARGAGGKGAKGGSGSGPYERTGYAEGHGLLHEKDIRMPMLPEHFDKVGVPPLVEGRRGVLRAPVGLHRLQHRVQGHSRVPELLGLQERDCGDVDARDEQGPAAVCAWYE